MTQPQTELKACIVCGSDNVEISVLAIEVRCHSCMTEIRFYVPEGTESQTKHAIIRKYNALPRSSPQVAPGLRDAWNAFEEKAIASNGYFDLYANRWPEYDALRDAIAAAQVQPDTGLREAIRGAIDKYNNQFYPASSRMTPGTVEDLSDIAANIAAAQGGQVDRSALNDIIGKLVEAVKSTKESFGEVKVGKWGDGSDCALKHTFSFVEIVKQANALDRFDFNSAVPSAPGSERVQKAWAAFHHEEITGAQIPNQWDYCYAELKHSIEALGQPQGADSLTDTTRLEK